MPHNRPDVIDRAAGLLEDGSLFALRAVRPEFLNGAETCRASVLTPADDLGLEPELRNAIARRISLGSANADLIAEYPLPQAGDLRAMATGEMPSDPKLSTIANHTDTIAKSPHEASAAHLEALLHAGLTIPQVIALSELTAFAAFQIRVVHGLALLKEYQ